MIEEFNCEYYIAKLKNLLQFSKREYIRRSTKILPKIEGAMIYLKGILPLFSKNPRVSYYQLKNINFSKMDLKKEDEERFLQSLDAYVLKNDISAMEVINHYYKMFLDKKEELENLHNKIKQENETYKDIFAKIDSKDTASISEEQMTFLTSLMSNSSSFTEEETYLTKLALFWNKGLEFQQAVIPTLNLAKYEYKQIPVDSKDVSEVANNVLLGLIDVIGNETDEEQIGKYFANMDVYSFKDRKYLLSQLINLTADNIASLKEMVLDNDFNFLDKEELEMVINSYNGYLTLNRFLNKKLALLLGEPIINDEANEFTDEPQISGQKTLILSSNDYRLKDKKSYIERDLDDLPEECFSRVRELLTNFEVGNNSGYVIKKLVGVSDTYEIKYNDQIRIVFSIGAGNNYIIKGVFQKKEDTANDKYVTISKRPDTFRNPDEYKKALEYSKERFEIMLNYLEENARKSNRY